MLKSNLKEEIIKLSEEILSKRENLSSSYLLETLRKLYEKSLVLNYVETHSIEVSSEEDESNAIVLKFEKLAKQVISTQQEIPESNPHGDDLITPGMSTIKDMVSHMETEEPDELSISNPAPKSSATLNDRFRAEFKLNLNDRLALSKHLFLNNTEDLDRVVSMINTIDTEERAKAFIVNLIKPEYEDWMGKEVYEERFMELITAYYS